MSSTKLVDKRKIKRNYTFHYIDVDNKKEIFFCKCGHKIKKVKEKQEEFIVSLSHNPYANLDLGSLMDNMRENWNIICPKCKVDYSQKTNNLIIHKVNNYFLETFTFKETNDRLILYKIKIRPEYDGEMQNIKITGKSSYLSFNKKSRKLCYSNFEKKKYYFSLDQVIDIVKDFFGQNNAEVIDNLIEIHRFINRLANFVADSRNFKLVEELLVEMIGKAGITTLPKAISIFFGIISYSNLSTIALTKGLSFLYNMMNSCILPNPSVLSDNKVTSPLKIFNFLVNLENKNIQKSIDEHNPDKQGYIFKSKIGNKNILYSVDKINKASKGSIVKSVDGIRVRDDLTKKTVSKYIFKNIKTFQDYKNIIKYTKLIKYEQLISLVMKYDIDLLLELFPHIEFRADINQERLHQFICLAISYAKRVQGGGRKVIGLSTTYGYDAFQNCFTNEEKNKEERKVINDQDVKYSFISFLDLTIYDDCLRMITDLKWDPNKEFFKIKDIDELEKYHNQLVKHYNMLSDKEKNAKFTFFAKKFKFLEEYNGNLKVNVLITPDMVLQEAKTLKNCASSYVSRISKEKYVLLVVSDLSKERTDKEDKRFMLGLSVTSTGLEFDQVKATCNRQGSNRFKRQIMKYLEDKDISYRALADLKILEDETTERKDFGILQFVPNNELNANQ